MTDDALDLTAVRAWLRAREAGTVLVLVCHDHPVPEGGWPGAPVVFVRVPGCLDDLPRAVPVELLLDGAAQVLLLVDHCGRREEVESRFGDLHRLLALGRDDDPLRVLTTMPPEDGATGEAERPSLLDAANMPVPRRVLLGADTGDATPQSAVTPHHRLTDALVALAAATGVPDPAVAVAVPGPGLLLNARGCTACGVCVRRCPEDALALTTQDGVSVLRHTPRACAGGGECIEVCPVDALSVRRQARWSEQLGEGDRPLATVETSTCTRCGGTMPDLGEDVCEVCAFRQADPFGSHLPPAAAALLAAYDRKGDRRT